MDKNELNNIGNRINLCISVVERLISIEELNEFQKFIDEQEAIFPLLNPTAYMACGCDALSLANKRVKALKNLVENLSSGNTKE